MVERTSSGLGEAYLVVLNMSDEGVNFDIDNEFNGYNLVIGNSEESNDMI